MHGHDHAVHLLEFLVGRVDNDVRPLGDDTQVIAREERRDLDDHVPRRIEAGHLEVHPGEHHPILAWSSLQAGDPGS